MGASAVAVASSSGSGGTPWPCRSGFFFLSSFGGGFVGFFAPWNHFDHEWVSWMRCEAGFTRLYLYRRRDLDSWNILLLWNVLSCNDWHGVDTTNQASLDALGFNPGNHRRDEFTGNGSTINVDVSGFHPSQSHHMQIKFVEVPVGRRKALCEMVRD